MIEYAVLHIRHDDDRRRPTEKRFTSLRAADNHVKRLRRKGVDTWMEARLCGRWQSEFDYWPADDTERMRRFLRALLLEQAVDGVPVRDLVREILVELDGRERGAA